MSKTELEEKVTKLEVVAETKEEKNLLSEKISLENCIKEEQEKNIVLEKEAEKFDKLASTINAEPFIELKEMIKEAIKTYTDKEDVKELKKIIKNFDAISEMENLLNEYKDMAEENRMNITANEQDIERMENKIDEINSKLTNFQTKLFSEEEQGKGWAYAQFPFLKGKNGKDIQIQSIRQSKSETVG